MYVCASRKTRLPSNFCMHTAFASDPISGFFFLAFFSFFFANRRICIEFPEVKPKRQCSTRYEAQQIFGARSTKAEGTLVVTRRKPEIERRTASPARM